MIFTYGRFFLDVNTIHIPYGPITRQLCYVVVPVILGLLLKLKWPPLANRIRPLLRPLALLFIAVILIFGTYISLPIYDLLGLYPLLLPTAVALPWLGFLVAGCIAFICRRSWAQILTIGIEAGYQNIGIAILVLIYSMEQPEGEFGALMPLLVSLFTPLPLIIALIVVSVRDGSCRCCRKEAQTGPESPEQKECLTLKIME